MIGVVGDAFIDRWVFGSVDRIAPEADCPVLRQERTEHHPGGADHVVEAVRRLGVLTLSLYEGRRHVKTRYVGRQQILRVDDESVAPIGLEAEDWIYTRMTQSTVRALVLSDYDKGVFKGSLAQRLITWALQQKIPTIVDPKGPWSRYANCSVITPNTKELNGAEPQRLIETYGFGAVLETRGDKGMCLHVPGQTIDIPPVPASCIDVTGAGDCVVAAIAVKLVAGWSLPDAAQFANAFAARSTEKWGTKCP